MRLNLLLAGLCLLAFPALAQPYGVQRNAPGPEFKALTGKLVRARCHMDYCGWFSIESAEPVGKNASGTLYVIASRGWSSMHKNGSYDKPAPRIGGETTVSYVFCSKTRPMTISSYSDDITPHSPKTWHVRQLLIGKPDGEAGVYEGDFIFYYAACHDVAAQDPFDKTLPRKLGYHVHANEPPDDVVVADPAKILDW